MIRSEQLIDLDGDVTARLSPGMLSTEEVEAFRAGVQGLVDMGVAEQLQQQYSPAELRSLFSSLSFARPMRADFADEPGTVVYLMPVLRAGVLLAAGRVVRDGSGTFQLSDGQYLGGSGTPPTVWEMYPALGRPAVYRAASIAPELGQAAGGGAYHRIMMSTSPGVGGPLSFFWAKEDRAGEHLLHSSGTIYQTQSPYALQSLGSKPLSAPIPIREIRRIGPSW